MSEERKLLRECRQFVSDAGCDEDGFEVNDARDKLLARMDALLAAPAPKAGFDLASKPDITAEVTVTINSAPAPEPVAWMLMNKHGGIITNEHQTPCIFDAPKQAYPSDYADGCVDVPLYTHPPASSWVRCEDKLPKEGENIWIAGCGNKGSFYSEAKYENGEWLMFDQVTDQHCWPCEYPDYWMPIEPLPPLPEDKQ